MWFLRFKTFGIYATDVAKYENVPNTDVRKIELVSDKQLFHLTEYIPGRKGTKFRIRYVPKDPKKLGESQSRALWA